MGVFRDLSQLWDIVHYEVLGAKSIKYMGFALSIFNGLKDISQKKAISEHVWKLVIPSWNGVEDARGFNFNLFDVLKFS